MRGQPPPCINPACIQSPPPMPGPLGPHGHEPPGPAHGALKLAGITSQCAERGWNPSPPGPPGPPCPIGPHMPPPMPAPMPPPNRLTPPPYMPYGEPAG